MPVYFNNCRARDHAAIYPAGDGTIPFFDLATSGQQALQAVGLPPGTECVVATRAGPDEVRFDWYRLSKEIIERDKKDGELCRVFYGVKVEEKSDVMAQSKAAADDRYAVFFNVNDHFKQSSVVS